MKTARNQQYATPRPKWESSQRLLHPKCIWIESYGGHRHFIFDRSISHENNNHSRADTLATDIKVNSPIIKYQSFVCERSKSFDFIQNKQMYLTVIGSADLMRKVEKCSSIDSFEKTNNSINSFSDDVVIVSNSDQSIISSNSKIKQINNEIDFCKNLLADRVLQWLDLAENRNVSVKQNDTIDKILPKRRSLTAKESSKSNDQTEHFRRDSIHRLSMTFNENISNDENPLNTNQIVTLRFDQFFPTTYRCSKKFLSLRRAAITSKPFNDHSVLIPKSVQSERKSSSAAVKQKSSHLRNGKVINNAKRLPDYFDEQYHSMIQRQILETSCNTQIAKRQLHIFMPNLPKKCAADASNQLSPTVQSIIDTESCISSQI